MLLQASYLEIRGFNIVYGGYVNSKSKLKFENLKTKLQNIFNTGEILYQRFLSFGNDRTVSYRGTF